MLVGVHRYVLVLASAHGCNVIVRRAYVGMWLHVVSLSLSLSLSLSVGSRTLVVCMSCVHVHACTHKHGLCGFMWVLVGVQGCT